MPATVLAEGARNTESAAQNTSGARVATMSLPSLPGRTSVTITGAISHASPPIVAAGLPNPRLLDHPYMKKPPARMCRTSFHPRARYGSTMK